MTFTWKARCLCQSVEWNYISQNPLCEIWKVELGRGHVLLHNEVSSGQEALH